MRREHRSPYSGLATIALLMLGCAFAFLRGTDRFDGRSFAFAIAIPVVVLVAGLPVAWWMQRRRS